MTKERVEKAVEDIKAQVQCLRDAGGSQIALMAWITPLVHGYMAALQSEGVATMEEGEEVIEALMPLLEEWTEGVDPESPEAKAMLVLFDSLDL